MEAEFIKVSINIRINERIIRMLTIAFIFMFAFALFCNRDMVFIASAIFAVACAIEQFTYKYFKNK